jgi:hypothetical protein
MKRRKKTTKPKSNEQEMETGYSAISLASAPPADIRRSASILKQTVKLKEKFEIKYDELVIENALGSGVMKNPLL